MRVPASACRPALILAACCLAGCPSRPVEPPPPTPTAAMAPSTEPPEEAVAAVSSGVRLLEQFRYSEAQARFEEALRLHPGWLVAQVDLAIAHLNRLEPEAVAACESSARAALAISPHEPRALFILGTLMAADPARRAEAVAPLREVVALAPDDPDAWTTLAVALEEKARDGDAAARTEAIAAYEKALALSPGAIEAHYRLGRLLLDAPEEDARKRGEAMLAEHEKLLRGRPPVQANYLTRGMLARAFPYQPARLPPATPAAIAFAASDPLPMPPEANVVPEAGLSAALYRGGLTVADLDGDGLLDVLAPQANPRLPDAIWWRQSPARVFGPPQALGRPGRACSTAAPGDFDNDGDLDLFLTCSAGNRLYLRDRDGWKLGAVAGADTSAVAGWRAVPVDFDHDGDLDLHVMGVLSKDARKAAPAGWRADAFAWRNLGDGRFQQAAASLGLAAPLETDQFAWTDLDGDNAVDLVATLTGRGLVVLVNSREGPFSEQALPWTPPEGGFGPPVFDLVVADADGDDDPDLLIVSGQRLVVLRNRSRPGHVELEQLPPVQLDAAPSCVVVADFDLDGTREMLLFGAGAPGPSKGLIARVGQGADAIDVPLRMLSGDGFDPEVAAPADVDNDGDVDLVVRGRDGSPVVLWNPVTDAPSAPHSVRVELAGREARSNRQGFGAKLSADAGRLHVDFERWSSRSALVSVAAPEILGIGARTRVDGLTVVWPSGIRQGEADLAAGEAHVVTEVDRQPSSCPMLYGWDGREFRFLTDCFDTAPLGLWVGPGAHWAGDPEESLRLRPGAVAPIEGVVNLSIAEFLNESLLCDSVAVVGIDHAASEQVVVDEGVRLEAPPQPFRAWRVGEPLAVRAWQDGREVSPALAAEDTSVAGYVDALPWTGFAKPHSVELELPRGDGLLVLTGSLNFGNSSSLFAAAQAGVTAAPPRLEVKDGGGWREILADCGLPAGFHKDVVVDLRGVELPPRPRLRITTNLQVSWDRAVLYGAVSEVPPEDVRDLPMLRATQRFLGTPREVKGPANRWREFPRDGMDGVPAWLPQDGPTTPPGDVAALVGSTDRKVAFVRPGEELLVAFDDAALGSPGPGRSRTHVLRTFGWVKDRDPHTALSASVLPLPTPGAPLYP